VKFHLLSGCRHGLTRIACFQGTLQASCSRTLQVQRTESAERYTAPAPSPSLQHAHTRHSHALLPARACCHAQGCPPACCTREIRGCSPDRGHQYPDVSRLTGQRTRAAPRPGEYPGMRPLTSASVPAQTRAGTLADVGPLEATGPGPPPSESIGPHRPASPAPTPTQARTSAMGMAPPSLTKAALRRIRRPPSERRAEVQGGAP
jgi:hypothetical protein